MSKQTEEDNIWSLFAPCPHQQECQLTTEKFKCKFSASYWPIQFVNDKKMAKVRTFVLKI